MDRVKRIWYLSPMRAAKVQASLRIRAVSPEPSLLAHTSRESRGTFRQKARSLAPLNGWACAVKICHDGMLEDTNSLDGAQITFWVQLLTFCETITLANKNMNIPLIPPDHHCDKQVWIHILNALEQMGRIILLWCRPVVFVSLDMIRYTADSKDSDQTARLRRLIWVLDGRTCVLVGFLLWSDLDLLYISCLNFNILQAFI